MSKYDSESNHRFINVVRAILDKKAIPFTEDNHEPSITHHHLLQERMNERVIGNDGRVRINGQVLSCVPCDQLVKRHV